jgi:DNA-binding LacI/PurR family transcriptional regulator
MVGTEFGFSQQWGLARTTVRRGIEILVRDGLLERRPGKGLFVRPTPRATRLVQVVIPNLAWSQHLQVSRGAQEAGHEHGVQIQIYDAHGELERDLDVIRGLPDSHADGAIIVSLHDQKFNEVLFELKLSGFPFVLVDQRLKELELPSVEDDNHGGGYLVGRKLAELGHTKIAFLGPLRLPIVFERLNGFRDAMWDAGVQFDRSWVLDLGGENVTDWLDKARSTEDMLHPILARTPRPTAIFDGSGDIAPFIYRAATKAGLRIPEDLSIVTFDDSPFNIILEPEVARLTHHWKEMGKSALEMLLKQMQVPAEPQNGKHQKSEHLVMPVEWSPGASLASPVAT